MLLKREKVMNKVKKMVYDENSNFLLKGNF